MPVNVRRFCTSILLILTAFGAALTAQTTQPPANAQAAAEPPQTIPIKAPTSAEIMRERISKAKAFIAVRNYNAAIYELENIRRETSDQSVQGVTNVLLMNSYLEQGDYKRAQDFLTQSYNIQRTNRAGSTDIYNAIAAQVTKCARTKLDRYKSLGLAVADRNLPLEAVNDVERMRETLELVITQAKEMGKDAAKTSVAMAMIEEASASRSALARDDYDARRWNDELADSREEIASSRSVITNAVDGSTVPTQTVALAATPEKPAAGVQNTAASSSEPKMTGSAAVPPTTVAVNTPQVPLERPVYTSVRTDTPAKPSGSAGASAEKRPVETKPEPVKEPIVVQNPPEEAAPEPGQTPVETAKAEGPLLVGSLIDYATKRTSPVYPSVARSMRTTGVVRVEVTIDEEGSVAEVQETSGPTLLQAAAKDAIRKWRFKPFTRDGQPVRATGWVNFNFSL